MSGPLAAWNGIAFGDRRVLLPVDAQGDLWGGRDHGRLHINARWPDDPPYGPPSVRWEEATVAELCRRLPPDATVGVGRTSGPVPCDPDSLATLPVGPDLGNAKEEVRLEPVGPGHPFAGVATAVGARPLLVRSRRAPLLLAVLEVPAPHLGPTFTDACASIGLEWPAALWVRDDLPRRVRRDVARLDKETP